MAPSRYLLCSVCVAFSISFHSKHIDIQTRVQVHCHVMLPWVSRNLNILDFLDKQFYENYFDTLIDTCKLHQSFYIIKTIFLQKKEKKIETWQYSISVYKHNNCAKISQTKYQQTSTQVHITYQFLNIPDSQRCHCPSRNKYKNIKGMTYSQRKDIKILRAQKKL